MLRAGTHALVVSAPSLTRLVATAGQPGGRTAWAARGLVELDAGPGTVHALRRRLARAGVVAEPPEPWHGAAPAIFPLPADAPVGGSIVVPAAVTVPAGPGGYLLTVVYQFAELAPGGAIARTFDAYGVVPWEAVVHVVASPPAARAATVATTAGGSESP